AFNSLSGLNAYPEKELSTFTDSLARLQQSPVQTVSTTVLEGKLRSSEVLSQGREHIKRTSDLKTVKVIAPTITDDAIDIIREVAASAQGDRMFILAEGAVLKKMNELNLLAGVKGAEKVEVLSFAQRERIEQLLLSEGITWVDVIGKEGLDRGIANQLANMLLKSGITVAFKAVSGVKELANWLDIDVIDQQAKANLEVLKAA
ncbi:MAG: hypothetical protein HY582_01070, partial [Candidatus Omnitrophica bacterium]|nr:hypothetical protein [Candidatus Omnitrophota bacterium]